jgi:hypothetical protein
MKPLANTFYKHKYGGIYQVVVPCGIDMRDGTPCVVYSHVYPFEEQIYIRPLSEWTEDRFKELIPAEVINLCSKDREQLQKEIKSAKEKDKR